MRNMTVVMEKYGAWVRTGKSSEIGFSHIAAGFKGLLPRSPARVNPCNDDDGLHLDGAMKFLRYDAERCQSYDCLVLYYINCMTIDSIAKKKARSIKTIQQYLRTGEGFVDGALYGGKIKLSFE